MSESKQRKDIERWMRQQLFRQRDGALERFALRSAAPGSKGAEVDTIDVPADFSADNLPMLVDDVLTRAQADADSLGNKLQRYTLIALESGSKNGPRFAFRMRGEGDEDGDEGDEPPTEKGLTSQLMRHNEALMRMLVMTTGTQVNAMSRRLEAQEKTMGQLFEERIKDKEAVEASKSLQHERDMQMLLTSGQEDRKNELIKKVESLLPLVVNKIAGRNVLPEGEGGDIFKALSDSLTPEQLQKLAQHLTGEQQMMLLTLIKASREPAPNGTAS